MTRGGGTSNNEAGIRRCIVTGERLPMHRLVRFAVGPENQVVPDIKGNLPGRGIWVSATHEALAEVTRKKLFAKAAKKAVIVPENLDELVESLLVKQVLNLLSLARKSGEAISGFEKVRDGVVSGSVAILLQARDGSTAQKAKIRPPSGKNTYISCLFGHELGLAFGRENVIHAALAAGGLSERIVEEANRLAGLRDGLDPYGVNASGKMPELEGAEDE